MTTPITENSTFEERCEAIIANVWRGLHNAPTIHKHEGIKLWWVCAADNLSTYDFDLLTRLVLLAHYYRIRVSVANGGPRRVKVMFHDRKIREGGHMYDRHPTLEDAIKLIIPTP